MVKESGAFPCTNHINPALHLKFNIAFPFFFNSTKFCKMKLHNVPKQTNFLLITNQILSKLIDCLIPNFFFADFIINSTFLYFTTFHFLVDN